MQWYEIIRLIVALWPIIEKIIGNLPTEKKAQARTDAIVAVAQVMTEMNKTA